MAIDIAKLLLDRPDVLQEYQSESTRDKKSQAYLASLGITNPTQFGQWWYDNYGKNQGYTQQTPAPPPAPADPVSPDPVVTTPTPEQDKLAETVNQLLGLFNQQTQQAQQAEQARLNARSQVQQQLGSSAAKLNSSILGTSVQDILNQQKQKAQLQLDRGKARGMFNDVGYNAGLSALGNATAGATAKLNQTAMDVLSGYRKQYDDLRTEALDYANNFGGVGNFDLTDYTTRANEILEQARTSAGGALQNAAGGLALFDLNAIRGEAGTAQGALNLKNLDVIDALAKRKQAEGVGRGLGSQGSF